MYINGVDFPNEMIDAIIEDKLVVFVGAGASKGEPTCLPDFEELVKEVARGTGETCKDGESCEAFLGRLKNKGINVNSITANILSQAELKPNSLHEYIINLFSDIKGIKIVTTNYDNMFEAVLQEKGIEDIKIFDAPALPLGYDVRGVIHIHGNVVEPEYMIVTDEDFGQAYLSDGYVSRFLVKLFENYTILFVGYSYNDVIVRYLTRAMTKYKACKRYILTDSKDGYWNELGIEPILFEKGRFDVLNEAINQLGIRIKRGLKDWERSLKLIAEKPPTDLTIESEVLFCMQDKARTRVLINCIHGQDWLQWLDKQEVFANLFSKNVVMSDVDIWWADWIIDEFLENDSDKILRLVLKYKNLINKKFAWMIAQEITNEKKQYDDLVMKQMIALIYPEIEDVWLISRLQECVMERKMYSLGWHLFKKMFGWKLVLKQELFSLTDDAITSEHTMSSESYYVERMWEKYGEQYKQHKATEIIEFGKTCILEMHNAYEIIELASEEHEPYHFCEIEIEEKTKPYGDTDALSMLCKIINEVGVYLSNIDADYMKQYIHQCIISKSLLLRKIGLKLLRDVDLFTSQDKLDILLTEFSVNALWEKEQIFKLVGSIFEDLEEEEQKRLLEKIKEENGERDERGSAYEKYNWGVWLQRNSKDNKYVEEYISTIVKEYPDFRPRRHPELNFDFESGSWTGDKSLVTKEELLEIDFEGLVELLDAYEGDKWEGPSRMGLLITFSNCVKDNPLWAKSIVKDAYERLKEREDVWDYFFRGLENAELNVREYIKFFEMFMEKDISKNQVKNMSNVLLKCIEKPDTKECYRKYKAQLKSISVWLWNKRELNDATINGRLIDRCYNSSTGIIMHCWIDMLSYEKTKTIPHDYKDYFMNGLSIENMERDQCICLLAGQVAYLFAKDRKWCIKNILPLLKSENDVEFSSAWEGVAWFSRRLYEELAGEMLEIYLVAIARLNELNGEARKGLVELFTVLLVYVVTDPIDVYIPAFLKVATEKDKEHFISSIKHQLNSMDEKQKKDLWFGWLKNYWLNRISNIPCALSDEEGAAMLGWLLEMGPLFPDAVNVFMTGTKIKQVDGLFWYKMEKEGWSDNYPDETIKLLLEILKQNAEGFDGKRKIQTVLGDLKKYKADDVKKLQEIFLSKNYFL